MASVRVNGIDVYYESTGDGPAVLLLHGLGSSTEDWGYQIPALAGSHRVIVMDVRGHGRSSKPAGPYSVKQFAEDAVGVLRALDAAPAHVVGLSMGGMIAFQMALDSSSAVRSLTIVNSGPAMIMRTLRQKILIQSRYAIVKIFGMRKLARMVAGPLFPKPEQAGLLKKFEDHVAANDPRAYLDSLSAINGWSVAERIGKIACPVLIVASDHDYTPVEWKRAYAAQIPGARVAVLQDSRHAGTLDQPEQFNRILLEFLEHMGGGPPGPRPIP
jgi:3-oxoadipate enol-lactonase